MLPPDGKLERWLALALGGGHLVLASLFPGLRVEHVLIDALLIGLPWFGPRATAFVRMALPLWLVGILMEAQPLFVTTLRGPIHTGDLRELELLFFPAPGPGLRTWAEWFWQNHWTALDLILGFAYATYLFTLIAAEVVLFIKDRPAFEGLAWAFLFSSALGVLIYILYPAAPPWYVIQHGPGPADVHAASSPAGTARFDELLGIGFFKSFYSRNPNVFGAMPSLHVAYPTLVVFFTWRRGLAWRISTLTFVCAVALGAVYFGHHYWLDVGAGLLTAGVAVSLVRLAGVDSEAARAPVKSLAARLGRPEPSREVHS